jgi:hypothetical protein
MVVAISQTASKQSCTAWRFEHSHGSFLLLIWAGVQALYRDAIQLGRDVDNHVVVDVDADGRFSIGLGLNVHSTDSGPLQESSRVLPFDLFGFFECGHGDVPEETLGNGPSPVPIAEPETELAGLRYGDTRFRVPFRLCQTHLELGQHIANVIA